MRTATIGAGPRPGHLLVPALLACYLVWGSTYLAIRLALESFPPFFQMGTRFLAAGGLLLAWSAGRGGAWPTAAQWRNAAIVGTLMLGLGMGLTATAEQSVGSGLVAAFIAVVPVLVCLWGLLVGQRPRRLELAGMAVGLAGVLLLLRGASFGGSPAAIGCMAAATLAWSLGSVLSATRLPLAPGAAGFASEMLCGGAALMLVSLVLGEQPQWPPQTHAALAWLYLVGAGSLVAFSAYLYLLGHAPPALATSYAFVNPVIALLLGVGFAGENVSGAEWAACAVILGGVMLILRGKVEAKSA
ncbi:MULTISPECIES: drug/metabolite exporter YedA [Ramlibacter]|uniref:Drug/metabolite exporter YedA n=1 Tax=Ramlibacter pinisoli TaxID=2682844 RepID=A0A6N8INL6_9BURK|nr:MULTISPECIES: drug/metabolite exporter YedA [Ramlibacter]MBA2963315.1 drug/metabolite exporter YedA [Ramlibacter sp. CGMCC 1.13660]MVQ28282.1 drug/metabolite exporter YedA [Ramlibacter pinisoli]